MTYFYEKYLIYITIVFGFKTTLAVGKDYLLLNNNIIITKPANLSLKAISWLEKDGKNNMKIVYIA